MLSIELTDDRMGELIERMKERAGQAVRTTARNIQIDAQSNAPVDTGALKNSIYVVTSEGSDYAEAKEAARQAVRGEKTSDEAGISAAEAFERQAAEISRGIDALQLKILPEVEAPQDDLTAIVAVGAEYGIYVEMGTSRQAAQPYLGPAAEGQRQAFEQAMRKVLS